MDVGSAIAPVIKVCSDPITYKNLVGDMDINAGKIIETGATIDDIGNEIVQLIGRVAEGEKTRSEELGHEEFSLGYKNFEPSSRNCD